MDASAYEQLIDLRRAEFLYELGRHREAIHELNRLMEIEPDNVIILCHLARCYDSLREYNQALAYAERAIAVDPFDETPHRLRSIILQANGDAHEALIAAENAVQLKPDSPAALAVLTHALVKVSDYQKAEEVTERLRHLAPDLEASFTLSAYVALQRLHCEPHSQRALSAVAAKYARQALKIEPESFAAFFYLGQAYTVLYAYRDAMDAYFEATRLNPMDEDCRNKLLWHLDQFCKKKRKTGGSFVDRLTIRLHWMFLLTICYLCALFIIGMDIALLHGLGSLTAVTLVLLPFALRPSRLLWDEKKWSALPPEMRRVYLRHKYRGLRRRAPFWFDRTLVPWLVQSDKTDVSNGQ